MNSLPGILRVVERLEEFRVSVEPEGVPHIDEVPGDLAGLDLRPDRRVRGVLVVRELDARELCERLLHARFSASWKAPPYDEKVDVSPSCRGGLQGSPLRLAALPPAAGGDAGSAPPELQPTTTAAAATRAATIVPRRMLDLPIGRDAALRCRIVSRDR